MTSLVKGIALPEVAVASLNAGACVGAEKSGVAEILSGFKTLFIKSISFFGTKEGESPTCRLCVRHRSLQVDWV
jgi:hypothetical protein